MEPGQHWGAASLQRELAHSLPTSPSAGMRFCLLLLTSVSAFHLHPFARVAMPQRYASSPTVNPGPRAAAVSMKVLTEVRMETLTEVREDIRNIAIVAHVDHGKTTLVDAMLQSVTTSAESIGKDDRLMDSNDQAHNQYRAPASGTVGIATSPSLIRGSPHITTSATRSESEASQSWRRTVHSPTRGQE